MENIFKKLAVLINNENLKNIISDHKKQVAEIDKNKSIFRRIQSFILDLGDPGSVTYKILNGSGVATKALLEVFRAGRELVGRIIY